MDGLHLYENRTLLDTNGRFQHVDSLLQIILNASFKFISQGRRYAQAVMFNTHAHHFVNSINNT